MAIDEKRRQKKLARKAAKRKRSLSMRKIFPGFGSAAQERLIDMAAKSPIYECLAPRGLFDTGMGSVVISRQMPTGQVALAIFLVDTFCLGVKNCLFAVISQIEYESRIRDLKASESLQPIQPACAVKLIEGAVAYAANAGFSPHEEYPLFKKIFGDIDPASCSQEFEFGKDGKPLYVSGPGETEADSERIMSILSQRFGPDGFHYLVGLDVMDD